MQTPTSDQLDRMIAAAMEWLRERRHIPRQELESEKVARAMVLAMLEAAR